MAAKQSITAYIGFDCTAASLHIGSLLPIMQGWIFFLLSILVLFPQSRFAVKSLDKIERKMPRMVARVVCATASAAQAMMQTAASRSEWSFAEVMSSVLDASTS